MGSDRTPSQLAELRGLLAGRSAELRQVSEHYSLLAGETRLKIMVLLQHSGELCVCDLASVLEMTPAAVSQHLSRLKNGRLVESRRDGMIIYYRVAGGFDAAAMPAMPRRE